MASCRLNVADSGVTSWHQAARQGIAFELAWRGLPLAGASLFVNEPLQFATSARKQALALEREQLMRVNDHAFALSHRNALSRARLADKNGKQLEETQGSNSPGTRAEDRVAALSDLIRSAPENVHSKRLTASHSHSKTAPCNRVRTNRGGDQKTTRRPTMVPFATRSIAGSRLSELTRHTDTCG